MIALKQSFALCPDQPVLAGCTSWVPLESTLRVLAGSRGWVHSANLFYEKTLTEKCCKAILSLSLPHEVIGTATPGKTGQKRPLYTVVFLCPSKIINTGLFRVKSFMVGFIRHPSWWLVPCIQLLQPSRVRHPTIATKKWRLYSKYRRNRNA